MLKTLLLAAIAFPILSVCAFAGAYEDQIADIREIKQRINAAWQAPNTDLDETVARLLSAEKGWWTEYTLEHPGIYHHGGAFGPPLTLARAYASPQSAHHASPEVLASIEAGLRYLQTMVYPGCKRVGNWWSWDIGMPIKILPMLFLLEGTMNPESCDAYVKTVTYLLRCEDEIQAQGAWQPPAQPFLGKTDTNALWVAHRCLQLAVLLENPAMAGKWSDRSFGEMGEPGDGFLQADYSYKFHGAIPMWAYGRSFLQDYAEMVKTYEGTYLGPNGAQLGRYAAMAGHFVDGFLYRGRICPALIGREISRGPETYRSSCGFAAADALAGSSHPQASHFVALAAREAGYLGWTPPQPAIEPAPPSTGVFAYPDSDFLQVTRADWALGIKMHSARNKGYESINQENLQGWFFSHGSMFYFLDGDEWRNCWPTIDWTRLPGTTAAVERKEQNESPFVGLVSVSGDTAFAAEELRAGGFQARKLWLVDGGVILCAGADIAGPGRVETTIINLPLPLDAEAVVDGQPVPNEAFETDAVASWIWAKNVGYVFLEPTRLHLLRDTRQSDWHSIRGDHVGGKGSVETQAYFTAVIPHTADMPAYAYAFCPRRASSEMAEAAQAVRSSYALDINPHGARVGYPAGNAFAFWEPGVLQNVETDRSCLLVMQGEDIHVADPAWRDGPFTLKVHGRALEPVICQRGRSVMVKSAKP